MTRDGWTGGTRWHTYTTTTSCFQRPPAGKANAYHGPRPPAPLHPLRARRSSPPPPLSQGADPSARQLLQTNLRPRESLWGARRSGCQWRSSPLQQGPPSPPPRRSPCTSQQRPVGVAQGQGEGLRTPQWLCCAQGVVGTFWYVAKAPGLQVGHRGYTSCIHAQCGWHHGAHDVPSAEPAPARSWPRKVHLQVRVQVDLAGHPVDTHTSQSDRSKKE